ncbi:MAG: molybdenum cofactor biosynthesis protein MoaE [Motiliproteus sp.]|nr:molybdenum cofactor biosynthesis protein MoaE [Motiliproteus sp.]MCW9051162.1 molybdenum cofactor biosynthesis protein MoaE [Motiliproteus sp.]
MASTYIQVQSEDFDIAVEHAAMRDEKGAVGAIATFSGLVRDLVDEPLKEMFLEHYPGMTEKSLEKIVEQARDRWDLMDVRIIHRIGALKPCDQIVFVATSSAHRGDAFAACQFIMDYLKKDAPFWKKETTKQRDHWVEQKSSDLASADRWQQK